mgnify:CR=1 FL=1
MKILERATLINAADVGDLQAALDLLPATGGAVYLPAGTYEVDRPIVVAPLVRGSAELFDGGPFSGKAVFLLLDGSVDEKTITKSKKIAMGGGKFLLQNGEGTVWGTEVTPKIAPPKVTAVAETPAEPEEAGSGTDMDK